MSHQNDDMAYGHYYDSSRGSGDTSRGFGDTFKKLRDTYKAHSSSNPAGQQSGQQYGQGQQGQQYGQPAQPSVQGGSQGVCSLSFHFCEFISNCQPR